MSPCQSGPLHRAACSSSLTSTCSGLCCSEFSPQPQLSTVSLNYFAAIPDLISLFLLCTHDSTISLKMTIGFIFLVVCLPVQRWQFLSSPAHVDTCNHWKNFLAVLLWRSKLASPLSLSFFMCTMRVLNYQTELLWRMKEWAHAANWWGASIQQMSWTYLSQTPQDHSRNGLISSLRGDSFTPGTIISSSDLGFWTCMFDRGFVFSVPLNSDKPKEKILADDQQPFLLLWS